MREWQELYKQLLQMTEELDYKISNQDANYEQIHLSFLSGLLGNIGFKDSEGYEYLGHEVLNF